MLLQQIELSEEGVLEEEGAVAVVALGRGGPPVDHLGRERHLGVHIWGRREHLAHGPTAGCVAAEQRRPGTVVARGAQLKKR